MRKAALILSALPALLTVGTAHAAYTVVVDPTEQYQTFEGWGTSLAGMGKVVGNFPDAARDTYVDLLFDRNKGLGLNVVRYNIGGGENPALHSLPYRAELEGFEPQPGQWNWNADAGQRWVLGQAVARGANLVEAFASSPPYWMTNSGSVTGAKDGLNNLAVAYWDEFPKYLAAVAKHFHDVWGITFRTVEPFNEPFSREWSYGKEREGCHFYHGGNQTSIIQALAHDLAEAHLPTTVSAADDGSIDEAVAEVEQTDAATLASLSQFNTHSYFGDKRTELYGLALARRKRLWMSGYDDTDASGITLAMQINRDMNFLHPAVWCYWQVVDNDKGKAMLWNPEDGQHSAYTVNEKYWAYANFTRFIRPGAVVIGSSDPAYTLATLDQNASKLTLVTTNQGNATQTLTYDLSKFVLARAVVAAYQTSASQTLAPVSADGRSDHSLTFVVPAASVTTVVLSGVASREPVVPAAVLRMLAGSQSPLARSVPYKNPQAPVEARVEDLLHRLSTEEKIDLLGAAGFTLKSNTRLGIPAFAMSDATMGVRDIRNTGGKATAYANGLALASTWDVNLARRVGVALGRDCRARGVNILLAPGMNLYRAPMCGRNFEYLGEDPLLAGEIAARMIQGVQSQRVAVTAKHFAANEQEVDRHNLSSDVDERTLRELYLKPFEIVVRNGAWGVMSSFNPLNGVHASQNDWLLNKVLKDEWGFKGFVMSDWDSCYDTLKTANAGLDIENPVGKYFTRANLLPLLQSGQVTQATIDDKVRRQLRVAFALDWFDRPAEDPSVPKDDPTSDALALQGAREAVTLLKNEAHLLPLDPAAVKKIVLLGHNADPAVTGGGGSAFVDTFHAVSVYQGIKNLVGPGGRVVLVPWKHTPTGKPHPEALDANGAEGTLSIPAEYEEEVRSADAVVVCVGFSQSPGGYRGADPAQFDQEGEDGDRSYTLPPGQAETIRAAAKLNPKTIVILNAGGSVATQDWIGQVPVLLDAFYPGQDGGTAIAEILFGKTNPSGKLAFSWEKRWENSAAYGNYPTYAPGEERRNTYKEGVFLGYRWFDSKGIEPLFPFGYGLSYTNFTYAGLNCTLDANANCRVTTTLKNVGGRDGAEIVQVYVQPPLASVPRPVRELKGFARVELAAGESRPVSVTFNRSDLAYWDPATKRWNVMPGYYNVFVGTSSARLLLRGTLTIP